MFLRKRDFRKGLNGLFQTKQGFCWKQKQNFLECHSTYPLRKNLVPEISADPQIGVGALSEENPLFPKLLHFRRDCSTELWKTWWFSVGSSSQTLLIFLLGAPGRWGLVARQCFHGILASMDCLRIFSTARRGTRRGHRIILRVSLAGRLPCLFGPLYGMVRWILVLAFP